MNEKSKKNSISLTKNDTQIDKKNWQDVDLTSNKEDTYMSVGSGVDATNFILARRDHQCSTFEAFRNHHHQAFCVLVKQTREQHENCDHEIWNGAPKCIVNLVWSFLKIAKKCTQEKNMVGLWQRHNGETWIIEYSFSHWGGVHYEGAYPHMRKLNSDEIKGVEHAL